MFRYTVYWIYHVLVVCSMVLSKTLPASNHDSSALLSIYTPLQFINVYLFFFSLGPPAAIKLDFTVGSGRGCLLLGDGENVEMCGKANDPEGWAG